MTANNNTISEGPGTTKKNQYSSVELSLKDLDYTYQFKIWESQGPEINILVNQDSAVLKYLQEGNTLDIKYYPTDYSGNPVTLRTEIRHIKRDCDRRIKGHCLIELAVNEIGKNN